MKPEILELADKHGTVETVRTLQETSYYIEFNDVGLTAFLADYDAQICKQFLYWKADQNAKVPK
jgi:hypothetical protein